MFPTPGVELCEHAAICQLALAAVEVDEGVISIAGTNLKICTRRRCSMKRRHQQDSSSYICVFNNSRKKLPLRKIRNTSRLTSLKGHCVVLREEIRTLNIYSINEVMMQTQKCLFFQ